MLTQSHAPADGGLILVKLTAIDVHQVKTVWIKQADILLTVLMASTMIGWTRTVPNAQFTILLRTQPFTIV